MNRTIETRYPFQEIELKWQKLWKDRNLYSVSDDDIRSNWYELTMFPYPSGDIHIGHWFAMTGADIHARFRSMQGYNVLHPMGFDAFGLNAENAAIERNIHPYKWTMDNIDRMRRQLESMGAMYDWERQIVTCMPEYYRWNQWFFLQFYKKGLAYRGFAPVNWCPSCVTVLANEQVLDGCCERCDTPVTHRDMNQWFFKITEYAEELLDESKIDWPENINIMQRNWIGKSEGVQVKFDISEYELDEDCLDMFTTRIDTIYGVTFVVMAPEHPLVHFLTTSAKAQEVSEYIELARTSTEVERLSTDRPKTGIHLGSYCVNSLTGEKIPIFIGDYVLSSYGTGIVMGVPAHDERDFEFARKYNLPIKVVVSPEDWDGEPLENAYTGDGTLVNSSQFDGIFSQESKSIIADHIEALNMGERTTNYRMRDWLISRQRYWGTPIPIIYCEECGEVPVAEEDLPIVLPEDAEFLPTGESPLAAHDKFVNVRCPKCHSPAKRETDTMDTFVDSSWYFLRYCSPNAHTGPFDPEALRNWGAVDQYTGGVEHAVMHLLYARFFVKAARDLGILNFDEPFERLFNQGTIIKGGNKMSKSRGNVVAPDEYVSHMGADVVRAYLMFIGPWEQGGEWSDTGINGVARWLNRLWDLLAEGTYSSQGSINPEAHRDLQRNLHKTIKKTSDDIENFKYNTAISAIMEFTRYLAQCKASGSISTEDWSEASDAIIRMIAPITPHLAEELWAMVDNEFSVHQQLWPIYESSLAVDDEITLVIQVNGKVRDKLMVSNSISEKDAQDKALAAMGVRRHIDGRNVNKIIFVPNKLVNIVTN